MSEPKTEDDLHLDEWQEEERTVPQLEFDVEFDARGNPTRITPRMTEKKIKQRFMYSRLTPYDLCAPDAHYFEIKNGGKRVAGRLVVQCRNCPLGKNFVVGVHQLIDGKIVETSINPAPPHR